MYACELECGTTVKLKIESVQVYQFYILINMKSTIQEWDNSIHECGTIILQRYFYKEF